MCGRFTLTTPTDELADYFRVLEDGRPSARGLLRARYNIAPTQPVLCVRRAHPGEEGPTVRSAPHEDAQARGVVPEDAEPREMVPMRWGLIPYWAKDPAIGNRMINARAESVADKPAYKAAFRKRRCLVPADGFYEWKKQPGGKQPYFIHLEGRQPFAFAGLWERWRPHGDQLDKIVGPEKPEVPLTADGRVESCAFLTTEPNALTAQIHDRMPLILPERHWQTWLDPDIDDPEALAELLVPYPPDEMRAYPVGTHVNKPAHDDPTCLEPLKTVRIVKPGSTEDDADNPAQASLF